MNPSYYVRYYFIYCSNSILSGINIFLFRSHAIVFSWLYLLLYYHLYTLLDIFFIGDFFMIILSFLDFLYFLTLYSYACLIITLLICIFFILNGYSLLFFIFFVIVQVYILTIIIFNLIMNHLQLKRMTLH